MFSPKLTIFQITVLLPGSHICLYCALHGLVYIIYTGKLKETKDKRVSEFAAIIDQSGSDS